MVAPSPLAPIWAARVHEVQLPSSDPLAAPAAPPRPPMDPQHAPALEEPAPARLNHPPPRPLPVSHHPRPSAGGQQQELLHAPAVEARGAGLSSTIMPGQEQLRDTSTSASCSCSADLTALSHVLPTSQPNAPSIVIFDLLPFVTPEASEAHPGLFRKVFKPSTRRKRKKVGLGWRLFEQFAFLTAHVSLIPSPRYCSRCANCCAGASSSTNAGPARRRVDLESLLSYYLKAYLAAAPRRIRTDRSRAASCRPTPRSTYLLAPSPTPACT